VTGNELVPLDIDALLEEEESIIKQTGVQGAWIIGEQLSIAKQKVINATGDNRGTGFLEWAERKFGWKHATVSRLQKAFRDHEEDIRKIWGHVKSRSLASTIPPLPEGKYRVIYADPPWKYNDELIEGYGAAEHHYRTMTIEELCEMPLPDTEENAVLFLWTTSPLLEDAFEVVNAWGFEYKTSFIWDKVLHNYGHYNSVRHEMLLVCTKGSCLPDDPTLHDSVQEIKRKEHSEKPEEFRDIIDALYTHGNKVELFARKRVQGWTPWGDEVYDGGPKQLL